MKLTSWLENWIGNVFDSGNLTWTYYIGCTYTTPKAIAVKVMFLIFLATT